MREHRTYAHFMDTDNGGKHTLFSQTSCYVESELLGKVAETLEVVISTVNHLPPPG